ncbi:MAG: GNAT family N-acetyltransferase [Aeromicrobium erythreum]
MVRPAEERDVAAAAEVLAAAFADYPWTRWCLPADDHAGRLRSLQELYLGHALRHGVVLVDDAVRGVVAAMPPDTPAPSAEEQARIAALHDDRFELVLAAPVPARPDGAWDLATLGVRPDAQGLGVGAGLVAALLETLGPTATVALDTSDDRNVRLYERFGFVVRDRVELVDGPAVHAMVRPGREVSSGAG